MNMDKAQERVLYSKPGFYLVKGKKDTGKSTLALYKAMYLENNYCLYESEKVLVVCKEESELYTLQRNYNNINSENKSQFISLFSTDESKVTFTTVDNLINETFKVYKSQLEKRLNVKNLKLIDEKEELEIFNEVFKRFREENPGKRIFKEKYFEFFFEEVQWIMSCGFKSKDEYCNVQRFCRSYDKGKAPSSLRKNSMARKSIYDLKELYIAHLKSNKVINKLEVIKLLTYEVQKESTYTHIIVDNGEQFRKIEINLLISMMKKSSYSNFICFNNKENNKCSMGWLVRSRKLDSLGHEIEGKNLNLKKVYGEVKLEVATVKENALDEKNHYDEVGNTNIFMEAYDYYDLRHNRNCKIIRDISNFDEIILRDISGEEVVNELKSIPVYNDIAAGEPIMINDELEGNFYLPEYFFKGVKDCFILKVKGDSMIDANIDNGDLVLLRKQSNALNNDIVAVDLYGSATLKRLNISKEGIFLMPENINYEPIKVTEEGASIMGVAIGILKNKN